MTTRAGDDGLLIRTYGSDGPFVVPLHGGPGAAGYMAPVARTLADSFRIIEPFQRRREDAPLTVASHVSDLHQVLTAHCQGRRPALAGHSWGAMLALAYAAEFPQTISCLVLIGCGTFDPASRQRLESTRDQRMDEKLARRLERMEKKFSDPDERLRALGSLARSIDSYDLTPSSDELESCDAKGHAETWQDMIRLQAVGLYPAAFRKITAPAIMLHGSHDPHPGSMIHDCLKRHMPQLEYREWDACGHYPWLERAAHEEFYATLRAWLREHAETQ